MRLEVLHVPDCPNLWPILERLGQVTDLPVVTRVVDTDADAARFGMAGSPTLLIDDVDPFAPARPQEQCVSTVSCRLYRDENGRIVPVPSVEQLRDAIRAAGRNQPASPVGVLSAWRTRALPFDPVEKATHQAILQSFAGTGRPPSAGELDPVTAGMVLKALHTADAIRLAADGQVMVAYPFSATPTRHRVRIGAPGTGVDVYAMCAIDALGIAPMLGQDTVIESVDVSNGAPVVVTTTGGQTDWEPAATVVFVGADGGAIAGGPSADCCCAYLNFFTDRRTAEAWAAAHPQVPGQILDRADAEALAGRLFGHLLAPEGNLLMTTRQEASATTREAAHQLAELIRLQFTLHGLLPQLYRMLSAGEPVTVEQVATAGGWTPSQVCAELDRHPGADFDDDGRIAGLGLTLRRTPHAFTFGRRTVHAFCASDALLFPVILEQPGVIESTCPASGRPIHVELTVDAVTRVEPATAMVSRVRPEHIVADVRAQICALGNFFASADAAGEWLAANRPVGTVVPVADDFDVTRRAAIELGWTHS